METYYFFIVYEEKDRDEYTCVVIHSDSEKKAKIALKEHLFYCDINDPKLVHQFLNPEIIQA